MYCYEFTPESLRQLKKLDPTIQRIIIKKLEYFISTDRSLLFAGHLINNDLGQYRFRIGDYRVIFDVEEDTIIVHGIGHRREIYK